MATSIQKNYADIFTAGKGNVDKAVQQSEAKGNQSTQEYIDRMNESYDKSIANQKASTDYAINSLDTQYQKNYDDNVVQAAINRRQIQESMANNGLTDSGLNRTQLTAVQLAKANADNAYTQQKNAAANTLRSQLQQYLINVDQQKLQNEAQARKENADRNISNFNSWYQSLNNNAFSGATSKYGTDVGSETSIKTTKMNNDTSLKQTKMNNDTSIKTTKMNNDTSIKTTKMNNATSIKTTKMNNDTSITTTNMNNEASKTKKDKTVSTDQLQNYAKIAKSFKKRNDRAKYIYEDVMQNDITDSQLKYLLDQAGITKDQFDGYISGKEISE